MTKDEALTLALEALKQNHYYMIDAGLPNQSMLNKNFEAITAIKEALAQPEQEPTGMLHIDRLDKWLDASLKERKAQRTWVGLTKNEVETLAYKAEGNTWTAVELTEAKLKEKNT